MKVVVTMEANNSAFQERLVTETSRAISDAVLKINEADIPNQNDDLPASRNIYDICGNFVGVVQIERDLANNCSRNNVAVYGWPFKQVAARIENAIRQNRFVHENIEWFSVAPGCDAFEISEDKHNLAVFSKAGSNESWYVSIVVFENHADHDCWLKFKQLAAIKTFGGMRAAVVIEAEIIRAIGDI